MNDLRYVYFKGDTHWVGWLEDYPDHVTQGETIADLEEHLRDLYKDIASGLVPGLVLKGELLAK